MAFFDTCGFHLPPFARWSPDTWHQMGREADEIRDNGLGWDVTDFGLGDFYHTGLLLFTIRNGSQTSPEKYPKGYAEKIMVVREGQVTPHHFHWHKREDIINRGGGELVLELYRADADNRLSDRPVSVAVDGIRQEVPAGGKVTLSPGASICLEPFVYHTFYGRRGGGTVLVGEVSDVNDDASDNCFLREVGRFPAIIEDEPSRYLLCTEYPQAAG